MEHLKCPSLCYMTIRPEIFNFSGMGNMSSVQTTESVFDGALSFFIFRDFLVGEVNQNYFRVDDRIVPVWNVKLFDLDRPNEKHVWTAIVDATTAEILELSDQVHVSHSGPDNEYWMEDQSSDGNIGRNIGRNIGVNPIGNSLHDNEKPNSKTNDHCDDKGPHDRPQRGRKPFQFNVNMSVSKRKWSHVFLLLRLFVSQQVWVPPSNGPGDEDSGGGGGGGGNGGNWSELSFHCFLFFDCEENKQPFRQNHSTFFEVTMMTKATTDRRVVQKSVPK